MADDKQLDNHVRAYLRRLGSRGGKARAEKLSAAEKSEHGKKMAAARWAKK
jgi:hypothetical protein